MISTETIIGVRNVAKSAEWYTTLLGCTSKHGADTFEILDGSDNGTVILRLRKWGSSAHSTLANPNVKAGNGIILYFRVSNFDEVWDNARHLYAVIEEVPQVNSTGFKEFSLRDIDGYYISICSDAASNQLPVK